MGVRCGKVWVCGVVRVRGRVCGVGRCGLGGGGYAVWEGAG